MTVSYTFYISTGAKNAMYTLRQHRSQSRPQGLPWTSDSYVCNLSTDNTRAAEKALDYFTRVRDRFEGEGAILNLDTSFDETLYQRRGNLSVRDTMSVKRAEAGFFPFGKHAGEAMVEVADGYIMFWADKGKDENPVIQSIAMACMGIALERGLIAKREAARQERATLDAKSNYVGQIGERTTFMGEVVSSYYKDDGYYITKIRQGDDLLTYIGNKFGNRGETVSFKATIYAHSEYNGVKSTQVKRPSTIPIPLDA